MEEEGEEIVVTAPRLRDEGGGGGWGGGWGGGFDAGWSSSFGADAFDFGGGGPAPAPEEPPAEVDPPVEEEIVVTAPRAEPISDALATALMFENYFQENHVGYYRVQIDGDLVIAELYDLESGEHVTYTQSDAGAGHLEQSFDAIPDVPGLTPTWQAPEPLGDFHIA